MTTGSLVYAAHQQATTARRAVVHATLDKGLSAPLTAVLGTVLDVAWSNPTAAQIKATGATGVIGYLSNDPTKNLSAGQVSSYVLAGIRVGTVWETTQGRALAGYAAGQADARQAEAQRAAIGLPPTLLHRAAVDTDTTWASVAAYFEGWASIVGKSRVTPYGGYKVTTGAYGYGLRRAWQTLAWSGGRLDTNAALYQNGHSALNGAADVNTILAADWGQYPPLEAQDMTLTEADLKVLLGTDGVLAAPPDAADIKTNPFWAWASHITNTTTNVRAILRELRAFVTAAGTDGTALKAQCAANGTGISALSAEVDAVRTAVESISATGITDAQADALVTKILDGLSARLAG